MKPTEVDERVLEALQNVLEDCNLSKGELAKKLGISQNKLSEILGKRMHAGMDVVVSLSVGFKVSPSWLLCGQGDMYGTEPAQDNSGMREKLARSEREIDYLNRILDEKERTIQILMNHQ